MTKIKICGFTDPREAAYVNGTSVYAMGMVLFCPKSKRNISIPAAKAIMAAADPSIKKVAVVVSPTAEQAAGIETAGFDYIQIHGTLSPEVLAAIHLPIIRAYNIKGEQAAVENSPKIAAYLFDAAEPGSGKSFDWSVLSSMKRTRKWVLAGGLTASNVARAIQAVHPDMVDVSSGVEYGDGRKGKDPAKIAAFLKAVEEADL